MDGKSDPALATALLAQAEHARAKESYEHTLLLCSKEHEHFLATVGNHIISKVQAQLASEERKKQAEVDKLVCSKAGTRIGSDADAAIRCVDEIVSQELIWSYMRLVKAENEIQNETEKYRQENARLRMEIDQLKRS